MNYININGFMGSTKVDLKISIPIEDILKEMPKAMKLVAKHLPNIIKAFEKLNVR